MLVQRLLGLLARRNVLRDPAHGQGGVLVILVHPPPSTQPAHRAIGLEHPVLHRVFLAHRSHGHLGLYLWAVFGVQHSIKMLQRGVLNRINVVLLLAAQRPIGGLVCDVEVPGSQVGALGGQRQALFAALQLLLGLVPGGDVGQGAEHALGGAVGRALGNLAPAHHPAPAAIALQNAVAHFVAPLRVSLGNAQAPLRRQQGVLVRMHMLQPALDGGHHLLWVQARQSAHAHRTFKAARADVPVPHAVACGVQRHLPALLALQARRFRLGGAQLGFVVLALADVAGHNKQADDAAVHIAQGGFGGEIRALAHGQRHGLL